jgi:Phosphate-selective porin O and P
MRIATSALLGLALLLEGASALAQAVAPSAAPVVAPSAAPAVAPVAQMVAPIPAAPPPEDDHGDLVGWRDGFFLRDAHDYFRFYPRGLIQADFYSSFGPGVNSVPAPDTESGLKPRLSLRRIRLGFDAEFLKRWSVTAIIEYGGQGLGNSGGSVESAAASPGQVPTAASGRYAAVQATAPAPYPADIFINYSVCKCFNIQLGQFDTPFSLENRTSDDYLEWMERSIAVRAFALQSQREIGGMVWGELGPRVFDYQLGVFGGDGMNRPSVDARVDFIGRIFVRPFAGGASSDLAKLTQIGVSARHGDRDPSEVAYDYSPITTNQGYALWKPTYTDSLGRLVHVIPSGGQNEIGGELRLQSGRFALQSEAYYVANDTREALDGYQLTNSERFGRMRGAGWYAQLSAWPLGDAFVTPEPGTEGPRHLDLFARQSARPTGGLEMMAMIAGVNASYEGASRLGSKADPKTPMGDITVYQIGVGANYWYTKHARLGINYLAYVTPGSGTSSNEAAVPDNLSKQANGAPNSGHVLHELGARLSAGF